jgi:hypothetical protein
MSRGIASSRICLEGRKGVLDAGVLASLLEALADPARFSTLVEQLQEAAGPDTTKVGVRVAALLQLMRTAIDAARGRRARTKSIAPSKRSRPPRQIEPRHDDRDARLPAGLRIKKKPISCRPWPIG